MKSYKNKKKDMLFMGNAEFFKNKRKNYLIIVIVVLAVTIAGSIRVGFDVISMFTNFSKAVARFFDLYFPPDFSEIDKVLEELWITVLLAISSGTVGIILAYFSALAISKTTGKIKFLKTFIRLFATLIRNIPSSIWAITLLMTFWFGEFLAFLVMTLGTYGFMTRVFADMIDETNSESIEALEATGSSYWQIIAQAVFPETLPVAVSWALYAIESNIRSATIIGMLAGGGIGYLIGIYKHFRKFELLLVAVFAIVATILISDLLATQIRKRILKI